MPKSVGSTHPPHTPFAAARLTVALRQAAGPSAFIAAAEGSGEHVRGDTPPLGLTRLRVWSKSWGGVGGTGGIISPRFSYRFEANFILSVLCASAEGFLLQ